METYEDKEGNIWSKEIKDGRLVEKLIERKKRKQHLKRRLLRNLKNSKV